MRCFDLPSGHAKGESREQALGIIREARLLWLEDVAKAAGIRTVENLERAF